MKIPMQTTFHGLNHSAEIESKIVEAAEKLHRIYAEIVSCRVVVDLANRRHRKGNLYTIGIDLSVPGTELHVGHEPGDRNAHKDVFVAIRDAFNAMERQLQEYAKGRRGEAKRGAAAHEKASELFLEEDADFMETIDDSSADFSRNGGHNNGIDRPLSDSESEFAEDEGSDRPRAGNH